VNELAARRVPQLLAASLCAGLACANVFRIGTVGLALAVVLLAAPRALAIAGCLLLLGWWWGSVRLDALDRSALAPYIGEAGRARVVVTGPARRSRFAVRAPGVVTRYARDSLHEPVLLELAKGRAPPQGAVLSMLAVVKAPRGPRDGFDERTWLRRRGVHVVLHVDEWQVVGHRGGVGGLADVLRRRLRQSVARGLSGERAAVLEGVVLGEEGGLSENLRQRFRAAGLYHLFT
jgi:predicted membrane metal-binding protein